MYRINRLNRAVLITVDEVITQCAMDQDADIRYIMNSIIVAEERWIRPALGNAMYRDLVTQKNVVVTADNQSDLVDAISASLVAAGKDPITADALPIGIMVNAIELVTNAKYVELWEQYLWKLTAECVDVSCVIPSWLRHTAAGQQKNNPVVVGGNTEGSATGDRKDVEYKIDAYIQSRIKPLIAAMEQWICDEGGFTLYPACKCEGPKNGVSTKVKGGIIFGVY
jgi:hypothetical protein